MRACMLVLVGVCVRVCWCWWVYACVSAGVGGCMRPCDVGVGGCMRACMLVLVCVCV